ncbi:MAG: biotin/lipoyl-containing protein [Fusobacterium sp.]|nr:biotin/lipoyl-containing protein [Fusobacterium sp.]
MKAGQEIGYVSTVGVNTTITSSYSGVIEEIYIENGNPVDYGRPLLKIRI